MKIISNPHKLLFFKTTDPIYLGHKDSKKYFKLMWSKKKIWICKQLKYYQLRIRSEIGISLEIILNAFKCLTVSLSIEILANSAILLISVNVLCELAMLPDVYFLLLLSPQEEEVHSSSWGDRCTHLEAHSSERLNRCSIILLVCLGNTY